jgi:hypothetical protein
LVLMNAGGRTRTLSDHREVTRHAPAVAEHVTEAGDGYVAFRDVCRQAAPCPVALDPMRIEPGSYLLRVQARNHRDLFKTDAVLTNLMLHLATASDAGGAP